MVDAVPRVDPRQSEKGDMHAKEILGRIPVSLPMVAQISLVVQLEYFTAELLEIGGTAARSANENAITAAHIEQAYHRDSELDILCTPMMVPHEMAAAERMRELEIGTLRREMQEHAQQTSSSQRMDASSEASLPMTYGGLLRFEVPTPASREFEPDVQLLEEEKKEEREADGKPVSGPLHHGDVKFPFPAPPSFEALPPCERISLRDRQLQVIVKIAGIVLKPNDAEGGIYRGGSWHVEGMENETIVASAIVYLESENITESRLAFRQAVAMPKPSQGDERSGRELYGIEENKPAVQVLGSVHTKAGRAIAFPNILQHRVQPFELLDRKKPGHRTILVYFLVDPCEHQRVISTTAHVAPQQREWVTEYLRAVRPLQIWRSTPLTPDLAQIVVEYDDRSAETTITQEQALSRIDSS
jgi:hypothetical protein